MRIAIGSDPNAESAKIELIKHIEKGGYREVVDFGSPDPIYANKMCIRDSGKTVRSEQL